MLPKQEGSPEEDESDPAFSRHRLSSHNSNGGQGHQHNGHTRGDVNKVKNNGVQASVLINNGPFVLNASPTYEPEAIARSPNVNGQPSTISNRDRITFDGRGNSYDRSQSAPTTLRIAGSAIIAVDPTASIVEQPNYAAENSDASLNADKMQEDDSNTTESIQVASLFQATPTSLTGDTTSGQSKHVELLPVKPKLYGPQFEHQTLDVYLDNPPTAREIEMLRLPHRRPKGWVQTPQVMFFAWVKQYGFIGHLDTTVISLDFFNSGGRLTDTQYGMRDTFESMGLFDKFRVHSNNLVVVDAPFKEFLLWYMESSKDERLFSDTFEYAVRCLDEFIFSVMTPPEINGNTRIYRRHIASLEKQQRQNQDKLVFPYNEWRRIDDWKCKFDKVHEELDDSKEQPQGRVKTQREAHQVGSLNPASSLGEYRPSTPNAEQEEQDDGIASRPRKRTISGSPKK